MILVRQGIIASSLPDSGGTITETWNISTASIDSGNTYDPAASFIESGRMRAGGSDIYYLSSGSTDSIIQRSLGTDYDLTTVDLVGNTLDISNEDSFGKAFVFNANGSTLYMTGEGGQVHSYTLSTNWAISSATYDNAAASLSALGGSPPNDIYVDGNESNVFVLTTTDLYSFQMTAAGDITTLAFQSKTFNTLEDPGDVYRAMWFKPDGTKMYIGVTRNESTSHIYQYALSTVWDTDTASLEQSYNIPTDSYRQIGSMYIDPLSGADMVLWNSPNFEYYTIGIQGV